MNNKVEVYARHISFDLMYDYIDNVSFTNQSCEYALNQLFRNSNFILILLQFFRILFYTIL